MSERAVTSLGATERQHHWAVHPGAILRQAPIVVQERSGIAGCCPRAVSGHAAAAPPMSHMNSRRLTSSTGLPPRSGPAALAMTTSWPTAHAVALLQAQRTTEGGQKSLGQT
jgi:hypothetical protein